MPTDHYPWTTLQKIAFRFFMPWLALQVLTENFIGTLFGNEYAYPLFEWGERIFEPPCRWLNDHLFHFKVIAQTWTTFSGSLHTIRDIVYLLLAALICGLWSLLDRNRAGYDRFHYWFAECLAIELAAVLFSYGIIKLFPLQMPAPTLVDLQTPVGQLSPFQLVWITFGYGTPYQVFSGIFEVLAAFFIVFRRTRVIGLLIALPLMLNVIVINYTYQVGVLITACYIFIMALFLLAPYLPRLTGFLLLKQNYGLAYHEYIPAWNARTKWFRSILLLFLLSSLIIGTHSTVNFYRDVKAMDGTRQYALVKLQVVNNDTLPAIENDTTRWRSWSERITRRKTVVTINTMQPAIYRTYFAERDTVHHLLTLIQRDIKSKDTLHFSYADINETDWLLEGVNKERKMRITLQRIKPDTTFNLLKAKRVFIILDDESDNQ
jgi:hypothetical protein